MTLDRSGTSLLLRDVDLAGTRTDLRLRDDRVAEIGPDLVARGEIVVTGSGGAVLPGLHDHHLHLLAIAAHLDSVDCTGLADVDELGRRLRRASSPGQWVRAVGYDEESLRVLDRHVLDSLVGDRPVRVQHRSGALWVLNTAALDLVAHVLDESTDVDRDRDGRPTGRLWRYDSRLRAALPGSTLDLGSVGRDLDRYGITGVTDATPDLDATAISLLAGPISTGLLPPVLALGAPDTGDLPVGLTRGPRKFLLRDHDLPPYDVLLAAIAECHERGRAVAVHCVTRESLLLTLAVLAAAGARPGDRIEHGSVIPPEAIADLHQLGVRVVTQPGLVASRGDDYLARVDPRDVDCLYPWASLAAAGVPVAASSDAPLGPLNPWAIVRAAASRRSASGLPVAAQEAVSLEQALAGYLGPANNPGSRPRRIAVGGPADLCVLDRPLPAAIEAGGNPVVLTIRSGVIRHQL